MSMDIRSYYRNKQFEGGFESMCRMSLSDVDLTGKIVVDVCCRRGKGVYKISDAVGDSGHVIGIDWNKTYINEAISGMDHAWQKGGLTHNNMDFRVAYPEDLMSAGIADENVDVVYINNVVTLLYDQTRAVREFARILKPGGFLLMETVFADRAHAPGIVERAREVGNSIQAASTQQENFECLAQAGFATPEIMDSCAVNPNSGARTDEPVEVVSGDNDISYEAVVLKAYRSH